VDGLIKIAFTGDVATFPRSTVLGGVDKRHLPNFLHGCHASVMRGVIGPRNRYSVSSHASLAKAVQPFG
jgi:hypothetical protein